MRKVGFASLEQQEMSSQWSRCGPPALPWSHRPPWRSRTLGRVPRRGPAVPGFTGPAGVTRSSCALQSASLCAGNFQANFYSLRTNGWDTGCPPACLSAGKKDLTEIQSVDAERLHSLCLSRGDPGTESHLLLLVPVCHVRASA